MSCEHGKNRCKDCGLGYCQHGNNKYRCKDCGTGYCPHGHDKYNCKDCGTRRYCQHGHDKYKCKDCGTGHCEHGRDKGRCIDCGTSVCEHGKIRFSCRICYRSCKHGHIKYSCKDCGTGRCEHGRNKYRCIDCGKGCYCPHGRMKNVCRKCGGFDSWARSLQAAAKKRAREDNLPYELTLDWIIEKLKDGCPVFKVPFEMFPEGTIQIHSASIDKFIPEKGYTKENSFVISNLANTIKTSATTTQVRAVADWMESVEKSNEVSSSIEVNLIQ
jgi:hypothetical protein